MSANYYSLWTCFNQPSRSLAYCANAFFYIFNHLAFRLLSFPTGQSNLSSNILRATSAIAFNTVHFDQIKPFLHAVLDYQLDVEIQKQVHKKQWLYFLGILIENVLGCRLKFQYVAGKTPVENRNIDIGGMFGFLGVGLAELAWILNFNSNSSRV